MTDDDCADHPASSSNVKEHGFFLSRRREDRRRRQHLLQLVKSLVGLVIPLEVSALLHEAVEGESFLSEPADEAVQGGQASGELLDVSKLGGDRHSLDGLDLHRVAFDAAFGDQEA